MGLCKCPHRESTNHFCYEHRVNVCEHCMVSEHAKCVVKSYLAWLDDSEYSPICIVCKDELVAGECIRLVCYDVFHKECFNEWASQLPPNTAPAGYKCPACSKPIFPASNLVSPVADAMKEILAPLPWARAGLGLPLIESKETSDSASVQSDWSSMNGVHEIPRGDGDGESNGSTVHSSCSNTTTPTAVPTPQPPPPPPPEIEPPVTIARNTPSQGKGHLSDTSTSDYKSTSSSAGGGGGGGGGGNPIIATADPPVSSQFRGEGVGVSRKGSSSASAESHLMIEDDADENKYKRRSAIEWFSRWWRTMNRPSARHHQGLIGGKRRGVMITILGVLAVITLLVVLSYAGRGASDDDPMLNPLNNPNIKVEED
ncbi:zinc finger protein-like 1 homolog [Oratosquilla oratoria]|uniref:zinc finger protein-like 1 homolog n=1 Tax=Oratosquilla oratoria TaxID=337810 RepID=UPI003F76C1E8